MQRNLGAWRGTVQVGKICLYLFALVGAKSGSGGVLVGLLALGAGREGKSGVTVLEDK